MKYREVNSDTPYFQLDDLRLDPVRQRVWRGPRRIDLPGLSFRLLDVLVRHSPRTVSRRDLKHEVWGDIVVSDDALRQRIRLLRRSLGGGDYIQTVKGIGYRLSGQALPVPQLPLRRRRFVVAAMVALALAAMTLLGSGLMSEVKHAVIHAIKHRSPGYFRSSHRISDTTTLTTIILVIGK